MCVGHLRVDSEPDIRYLSSCLQCQIHPLFPSFNKIYFVTSHPIFSSHVINTTPASSLPPPASTLPLLTCVDNFLFGVVSNKREIHIFTFSITEILVRARLPEIACPTWHPIAFERGIVHVGVLRLFNSRWCVFEAWSGSRCLNHRINALQPGYIDVKWTITWRWIFCHSNRLKSWIFQTVRSSSLPEALYLEEKK